MSESAYGYGGGESAGGGFFGGCGMTNWSSTRSARPNPDPVGTKHQRVIRSQSPIQEEKKEEKICDIGALRKKVMEDLCEELYEEVYSEIKGEVKADQLMGPVAISDTVSNTQGIVEYVYMMALISLSLGVTNLLPFPPLDGGKVVILLIEAIRRKPLKENIEIGIQMAGFCLLIGLSIYVTYNDILRIF